MRMLRSLPVLLLVLATAGFTAADPPSTDLPSTDAPADRVAYEIDKDHTAVAFKVRHLGISNVTGTFTDYDATLNLDPTDLSTLQASARIRTASVDTGNDKRDDHLRSADFFDAEAHPEITFESTGVRRVDGDRFELDGDLTIHGVTKSVVLVGELIGTAPGPMGKQRVGLEAETTVDRRDFGLEWNRLTEAGGVIVGHDVKILLEVEAVQAGV